MVSYENVPYPANPHWYTHPNTLAAYAHALGVESAPPENCRVLEIGGANGANLIPMALNYPNSTFVGVEPSEAQTLEAQKTIKLLKLNNIEIKPITLKELDESTEKFDYIIAHGVYSWVPEFVQEEIMEYAGKFLADNGVFYVSYNMLPGWCNVKTVRDLMLFHTRKLTDPNQIYRQSAAILNFLMHSYKRRNNPLSLVLEHEFELIQNSQPRYFLHDHLEDNNNPRYFKDVNAQANQFGLRHLTEIDMKSTFNFMSMKKKHPHLLDGIEDPIRYIQYRDFILNLRFQWTLFVKDTQEPTRELSPEIVLNELALMASVDYKLDYATDVKSGQAFSLETILSNIAPEEVSTESDQDYYVELQCENAQMKITNPVQSAMVAYLFEKHAVVPIQSQELCQRVHALFPHFSLEQIRAQFLEIGVRLVRSGVWNLAFAANHEPVAVSDRPRVNDFNRLRAETGLRPVNPYHRIYKCDEIVRYLSLLADGQKSKLEIVQILADSLSKGELPPKILGMESIPESDLQQRVEECVDMSLATLERVMLLTEN